MDLGIEVILDLFTKNNLQKIFNFSKKEIHTRSENAKRIYALKNEYIKSIDNVITFLQGKNQTFARQICSDSFLPQASKFDQLDDMEWAFGNMGIQDKAKHLGTLFLEDIGDFIVECVDQHFGFSRYAERLGQSANDFDELYDHLQKPYTFIDQLTLEILGERLKQIQSKLVCISCPFPGNLYSAFRCAQFIKKQHPRIKIALGGGFPNTELRSVSDARVFEYFDFITLDDGELPIELLADHVLNKNLTNPIPKENKSHFKFLKRTFLLEEGKVVFNNSSLRQDYKQFQVGTPDYSDLKLDQYISVIEIANPMHSLWSDGRWNKLTMAHGCYWGKCTFCDISLDYIKNYEPIAAKLLVDRMEELIAQTGETGFHFVDEAAPPALMRELAVEILKRELIVSWWTNIRFEKNFSADLCRLLKVSGCIAVSGGLEVASDRLLALIDKGVTVEQVAQVSNNFTQSGIMVHAYLMYGYPTQTVQETIDSLEMVRQMFELGILQSGFWHQFALTAHSPVGLNPEAYGVIPKYEKISFANNDIQFEDKTGIDHTKFSFGLKKSLFNFMHDTCFDFPLQEWFEFKIPKTSISKSFIENCLETNHLITKSTARILWIGQTPEISFHSSKKKGVEIEMVKLVFCNNLESAEISFRIEIGKWLMEKFDVLSVNANEMINYAKLKSDFETNLEGFEVFWYGKEMDMVRNYGLLVL